MIVIPNIELRDRHAVPSVPGTVAADTDSFEDPVALARRWAAAGFTRLQVVDLDAANGHSDNRDLVRDLLRQSPLPIQVAGVVQDDTALASLLEDGADQVVVGARGVEDPTWLIEQAALAPGRLILAADLRDGLVASKGWAARSALRLEDLFASLASAPLAGLLLTAVRREGKSEAIDLALIEDAVLASPWPVIVSSSVNVMQDLHNLEDRGVSAVVLGMSLYTAEFDARVVAEEFAA